MAERFFLGQDRLQGPIPDELLAPSYTAQIAGFPTMDASGHGAFWRAFSAAFPDLRRSIDDTIVGDGRVVVRFTLSGAQQGDFMGIPPTGRPIEVHAIGVLTIDGGLVTHLDAIFDQLGLMKQLGVLPS